MRQPADALVAAQRRHAKVVVTDPLQAHMDQLMKWTDADMHN